MSAPATLKSLTLTAFRGSTATFNLDFEKGKKLTLLYGENASGKTDDLRCVQEFLASDNVGSLDERGMGKGLEKYWHAVGKLPTAVRVELQTTAGTCVGTITSKRASVSPAAARPRIELLRQRQILEIDPGSVPAQRYDKIKRFIDISEAFERSERDPPPARQIARGRKRTSRLELRTRTSGRSRICSKPLQNLAGLNAVSRGPRRGSRNPSKTSTRTSSPLASFAVRTKSFRVFLRRSK